MSTSQLHAHTLASIVHAEFAARASVLSVLSIVFVIALCMHAHTNLAVITVEEVFAATCLAGSTFVAVKYFFTSVVVKQIAMLTKVLTKSYLALSTRLLRWLLSLAVVTLDSFNGSSVKVMWACIRERICFAAKLDIVAETAREEHIAVFALYLTFAVVVNTCLCY